MAPRILTRSLLPSLVTALPKNPPTFRSIQNMIIYELQHEIGLQFIVDDWPDFRTVFRHSGRVKNYGRFFQNSHSLATMKTGSLAHILDWSNGNVLPFCSRFELIFDRKLHDEVTNYFCNSLDYRPTSSVSYVAKFYPTSSIVNCDRQFSADSPLQFDVLRPGESSEVARNCRCGGDGELVQLIENTIKTCENVAIRTKGPDHRLVTYAMEQLDSSLGMPFTMEDFRNQGLGKLALNQLACKLLKKQNNFLAYGREDDEVTLRWQYNTGFKDAGFSTVYGSFQRSNCNVTDRKNEDNES